MKNIITALVKARANFLPIVKDKINPHFKSKYADIADCINAVTGALLENEIIVTQTPKIGEKWLLITTLYHSSGEKIEGEYPLPQLDDAQKFLSAIAYARRGALCAILNIAADDDSDGNNAAKQGITRRDELMIISEDLIKNSLRWNGAAAVEFLQGNFGKSNRKELAEAELENCVKLLIDLISIRESEAVAVN